MNLLSLESFETWAPPLITTLERNHNVLLDWETDGHQYPAPAFDRAITEVGETLKSYSIRGWHCTRLTDAEVAAILSNGAHLPNAETLNQRVDMIVAAGLLSAEIAERLKAKNQAGDSNRAGKLWFCFYAPKLAGEGGIGRFFRHWGGEALYNYHEDNCVTSPPLRVIGTPRVVVAEIPIAFLSSTFGLATHVTRRFLTERGHDVEQAERQEGYVVRPLPSSAIREVVTLHSSEFSRLTGCDDWREPPLSRARRTRRRYFQWPHSHFLFWWVGRCYHRQSHQTLTDRAILVGYRLRSRRRDGDPR
ncbi:hypothetical protein B0G69_2289 [Paraburkholderia sp. RAU2J]|nr:hypothetical protein B0G69_2289 [Paraburkholderia sp. RAU2J]